MLQVWKPLLLQNTKTVNKYIFKTFSKIKIFWFISIHLLSAEKIKIDPALSSTRLQCYEILVAKIEFYTRQGCAALTCCMPVMTMLRQACANLCLTTSLSQGMSYGWHTLIAWQEIENVTWLIIFHRHVCFGKLYFNHDAGFCCQACR